ncbi:C4-dicarboxylate ABC transporter substrate-binding protein [Ruegeria profundi]|uniref:TRAP transporter small permease protein n=2 Tax=Ruegeria profundi TaxID=1685378 RepID=A0A0X3U390_9RHOB|nr:C4-dicarboxylate ABC transporter substrate-binding protein [Ruegeria profundi]
MKRVHHSMTLICRIGALVAFSVLIIAVLTQVIGRTIGNSPVWTEELTRFALIYLTAFGTGVALMTGDLVNVDVICDALPGDLPRKLRMLASAATAILSIILIPGAVKYVKIGTLQSSPALALPMEFVHFSVLLLLGLLAAFAALRFVLDWAKIEYRPQSASGAEQ